ncbi:hypothetical protein L6R53_28270 [Myxococcota bacterium]|nr:hypothetical protein [Myxococcota bacterium]
MNDGDPWWGEVALELGQAACWHLGQVDLWVQRRAHEWRVAVRRLPDGSDAPVQVELPAPLPLDAPGLEVHRFGAEQTSARLQVSPVLAPRPVVCRPDTPFALLPGSAVTAYVGTPLWVRVQAPGGRLLHEVDLHRPSGTWFGPDTRQGELCYANRTRLKLDAAELQHVPTRAITPVHLSNDGDGPLVVRRINLPVPKLELGVAPGGTLWTDPVRVRLQQGGQVTVDIDDAPPERRLRPLAPPRVERRDRHLIAALADVLR